MAQMECFSRGSTASVQVEQLVVLVSVENEVEVTMTEENVSADEAMWFLPCESLNLSFQIVCHLRATKLIHELIVVNSLVTGGLYGEGSDNVLLLLGAHYFLFLFNSTIFLLRILLLLASLHL